LSARSEPPGTASHKVLEAVRKLALNEWQLKHRYAMALHTDDDHPHVHVVLKARSEQGRRLNIKKATLRSWRNEFASNLRELGVAANATERAVRGETKTHRSDGTWRAENREGSTLIQERERRILREWSQGSLTQNRLPDALGARQGPPCWRPRDAAAANRRPGRREISWYLFRRRQVGSFAGSSLDLPGTHR
jgi:Relaxase/Mobilisation nuclease domain